MWNRVVWDNFIYIKKIDLGQLYKKIKYNFHPTHTHISQFATTKKELWDTHFYSIFILDAFYNKMKCFNISLITCLDMPIKRGIT